MFLSNLQFYASGNCRLGSSCKFTHAGSVDPSSSNAQKKNPPAAKQGRGPPPTGGKGFPRAGSGPPHRDGNGAAEGARVVSSEKPAAWGAGTDVPTTIIAPTAGRPESGDFYPHPFLWFSLAIWNKNEKWE